MMFSGSTPPVPDSVHYTEYGIPIRNLWHMCLYAWNDVSIHRHWSMDIAESAPTLYALLASVLARLNAFALYASLFFVKNPSIAFSCTKDFITLMPE